MDGVAQAEDTGQDLDCAASESGDRIHCGLEDFLIVSDQVAGAVSDRDGEAFVPIRFDGGVAGGGARVFDSGRGAE